MHMPKGAAPDEAIESAVAWHTELAAPDPRRLHTIHRAGLTLSAVVALVSLVSLAGWVWGWAPVAHSRTNLLSMKVNTATCSLLLVLATVTLSRRSGDHAPEATSWRTPERWSVTLCAGLVGLDMALVLVEYAAGLRLGWLDTFFGLQPGDPLAAYPGRPAPITALAFVCVALAHLGTATARVRAAQALALVATCMGYGGVLGRLCDVRSADILGLFGGISLPTATVTVLSGAAVLSLSAGHGYLALLTGNTAGGIIVRRLMPLMIALPAVLTVLVRAGARAGLYDAAFALGLFVLTVSIAGVVLVWQQAYRLRATDLRRKGAESAVTDIRRLLAENTRQARRLEQANRDLDAFAAMAAHDLRSPLGAIRGYAELLGDLAGEGSQEEMFALRIGAAATRGAALIEDLLVFSRVGTAELRTRPVDLDALVREVVEALPGGERVTVTSLPTAQGDTGLLRQVVANVVGNALKYAPDSPVEVSGRLAEAGRVELAVSDHGRGIPADQRERMFTMFERGQHADLPGTGVGLAICERVVGAHQGQIWIEETPGGGATFRIELPAAETSATGEDT